MANVDDGVGGGGVELPQGTWSVAELNDEIASVIDDANDRFPTYIVGEVSDVSSYDFGTFFDFRDLEDYTNTYVLRRAMAEAGMVSLDDEVDSFHRLLTADEVSEFDREEAVRLVVRPSSSVISSSYNSISVVTWSAKLIRAGSDRSSSSRLRARGVRLLHSASTANHGLTDVVDTRTYVSTLNSPSLVSYLSTGIKPYVSRVY